ncbi:hypothetical protein SAMN04489760_1222 [Syntrophus gentianae]|uniref:Uncharacterized protein n=1 Tax=Syntrophus gentianae TaxID=43775 RepID=A0A1H7ZBN6_9BACT|nr:hypothetical protein [Syntrophus gentianae]SEM55641.1 hypothetical protein SAMN04489760_1222 [Syntrophus gentianae]
MTSRLYKIGLASRLYDSDGALIVDPLPEDTQIRENTRRLTRTKTLDGGVVITDSGFSHGDRTFDLAIASTPALWSFLWSLFQNSSWITVTTDEACFLAKMEDLKERNGKITMKILVSEVLTE